MQQFNLIEESWIRVLDNNCQIREVGIREALLRAHEFSGLAGEIKTQDFAVLRFLLAMMYTIFYRYDIDGSEIDLRENKNIVADNWVRMWENGCIPLEPVEKYLSKWQDRFWLFDDVQPFYQTKAVEGKTKKTISSAKISVHCLKVRIRNDCSPTVRNKAEPFLILKLQDGCCT